MANNVGWRMSLLPALLLPMLLLSCGTSILVTKESALGQELIYRSLERAVNDMDVKRYQGDKITVTVYTQTDDELHDFAKRYVIDRLKEKGLSVVDDASQADLTLDVIVSVLGLNRGETLLGIPSVPTPFLGITTPELALYKASRNRGEAEIRVYTFDARTGRFIAKSRAFSGSSYYNRNKLLLFINFTRTDLK